MAIFSSDVKSELGEKEKLSPSPVNGGAACSVPMPSMPLHW